MHRHLNSFVLVVALVLVSGAGAVDAQVTGSGTTNKIPKWSSSSAITDSVMQESNGHIGIGTADPDAGLGSTQEGLLRLFSANDKNSLFIVENAFTGSGAVNAVAVVKTQASGATMSFQSHATPRTVSRFGVTLGGWNEMLAVNGNGLAIGTNTAVPLVLGTAALDRFKIDGSGNVNFSTPATGTFKIGIPPTGSDPGVDVTIYGKLTATKVIGAVYQDLAEWVPATTHMEPGTVVVLNRDRDNEVMPSHGAYDTAVAGVVSADPGVILGVAGDSKAQIATTGRVKVRVDAGQGGIRIGDLLVTSDKPGTAMKSQPIDLGGTAIHRPGTVIGKALQPLTSGEGEILVLLSLQ